MIIFISEMLSKVDTHLSSWYADTCFHLRPETNAIDAEMRAIQSASEDANSAIAIARFANLIPPECPSS
jgi:hypothetical protein